MSMLIGEWPSKYTTESADYAIDWSDRIDCDDPILTSSWSADTGITTASASSNTKKTWLTLSGGTAGQTYKLINTITTKAGRIFAAQVKIKVKTFAT